jgi:hypothetical protein
MVASDSPWPTLLVRPAPAFTADRRALFLQQPLERGAGHLLRRTAVHGQRP